MRFARAALMVIGILLFTRTAWAKTDTVRMQDFQFVPKVLIVNPGDTVVWKSIQQCCDTHTTTRDYAPAWNSGSVPLNGTFQRAFTEAGSYEYYCTPHKVIGMIGQISVTSKVPSNGWPGLALLFASLGVAAVWWLQRKREPV